MAGHLAGVVSASDSVVGASRLSRVARGLREPWSVPEIARELRDGLAAPFAPGGRSDLSSLVTHAAGWLDLDLAREEAEEGAIAAIDALWSSIWAPGAAPSPGALVNEELLEQLSAYMAACHDALDDVAAALSDEERVVLRRNFPDWCEAWYRGHFPKSEVTPAQAALLEQFKGLARKVDRARLLAVAARVARLADPVLLATLGRRLSGTVRTNARVDGFSGDVVATAGGGAESRVVLLGTGRTTVTGRAALVIDLGGDDVWNRAAVVDSSEARVSVVLELQGNDRYETTAPGPAYAAGGVALLVDAKGKDRYESARLGQGSSVLGFAALLDLDGADRYAAHDFVQGFTFGGAAFLLDRAGDDVYEAWAYAQGAGCGNGVSACVDGGGDDRYRANGRWPDVYGDSGPDSFHGASQGYCTGFRDGIRLAGGIAALIDLGDGRDDYESGNFSQGGGYYFSFGLMYDGGGDDVNRGCRYSQGFGVHQACGIRWDAGGDDHYATRCAANCGSAWDQGVGWLVDEAGDDVYEVGGLALGGTANSGVAVLLDLGGNDRYGGGGGVESQGGSGDSSYHQFQAIGALIDLGGGKDSYTRKERGDDRILTGDWYGIFVDAREKSVEKLLDPKALQRLLAAPREPPEKPARKRDANQP